MKVRDRSGNVTEIQSGDEIHLIQRNGRLWLQIDRSGLTLILGKERVLVLEIPKWTGINVGNAWSIIEILLEVKTNIKEESPSRILAVVR